MNVEQAEQAILDDILACGGCTDIGIKKKQRTGLDKIEYLKRHLPLLDYVLDETVYYIFSSGITTGDTETSNKLNAWLEKKNVNGIPNGLVLKAGVRNSLVDGCCGLRAYNNDIYTVNRGFYATLTQIIDGIERVVGFLVRQDGKPMREKIELKKDYQTLEDIYERFQKDKLIFLDKTQFTSLRNNTAYLFGDSPLLRDQLRLDLLVSEYEHLNYDIDFDGPGRIVLHVKDGITTGEDASSTQLINQSGGAQSRRNDKALAEARRIGKEIKDSSSDAVITLSNAFDKDITHLPRVTKSTDDFFREWIRNEGTIIAQDIGISPALLELGDISGNVSMEKIIDNAVTNTVIPIRDNYAPQFSDMISGIVGVPKVYFDDYKLAQVENVNNVRQKVANMIRDISVAQKNAPSSDKEELSEMLTDYLMNSLTDEAGRIEELNDKR